MTTAKDVSEYDGPPDYRVIGRHDLFPQTDHDEIERINFLAQMNRHLAASVVPGVKTAYEQRVVPAFKAAKGRPIADRHEARKALLADPAFQTWSALRRMTMEQRQQAGRWTAIRQRDELAEKARQLTEGSNRLQLDPTLEIPRYVSAVDHHCMPGSYHTEAFPGDVANGANYDHAGFVTTSGLLGKYSDGGGQAVVQWVRRNLPDFKPTRILEIGGTVGHSSLPLAQAFPEADMTVVDLGAPVLRYGLGRAMSLGVDNIRFVQASGEDLSQFEDASFDWIQTTMLLHELSTGSMRNIMRETRRLLKPGGFERVGEYYAANLENIWNRGAGEEAARIRVPILLQWCDSDPLIPADRAGQAVDEFANADVTLIRYAELGHYPMLEAPQKTGADLKNFFDRALVAEQDRDATGA